MSGQSTSQQTSAQTTAPWAAAQPLLNNIIGQLGATNPAVTPAQTAAYGTLGTAAGALPNYAPQAATAANAALGTNTNPQQNLLTGANNQLQSTLSPYLSSSYLNPMTTPGLSTQLQGLNNSITNGINSQFAAAGRDLSPANSTALAYGLAQGEAPVITNQYNANVGAQQNAANTAFGGANTTAGGLTQQQLAQIEAQGQGLNYAAGIPSLGLAPGTAQEQVATSQAQQPYTNLGWLSSLAYPLGALGSQSTGTASGTTTQPFSTTLAQTGVGLNSLVNPFSFLLSDARAKEDIKPIGMLYDGLPVYSYKYVKEIDPEQTPHIGLIAQDVEKTTPEAVKDFGGVKAVDYSRATQRSRLYGMLADLDMAA